MTPQKPLTVAKKDFEENLRKLINDSQLPVFMVEMILEIYYRDLREVSQQLESQERARYHAELINIEKKEGETDGEAEDNSVSTDKE